MATTTAKDIIELKSPDLVGDPRIDDFITLAKFHVAESVFMEKYQYALALVVLHQITLDNQGGGSSTESGSGSTGGIKKEKEGDLEREFGNVGLDGSNQMKKYYNQTSFGQELLQLMDVCIFKARNRCFR